MNKILIATVFFLVSVTLTNCNNEGDNQKRRANNKDTILRISLSKANEGLGWGQCNMKNEQGNKFYFLPVLVENFNVNRYEHRLILESFVLGIIKSKIPQNIESCVTITCLDPKEYDKKYKDDPFVMELYGTSFATFIFHDGICIERKYFDLVKFEPTNSDTLKTGVLDTFSITNDYISSKKI